MSARTFSRLLFVLVILCILGSFSSAYTITPTCPLKNCKTASVVEKSKNIAFINAATIDIYIYWVAFNGTYVLYNTLSPQQSYTQETYNHHVWAAATSSGGPYFAYYVVDLSDLDIPFWTHSS
ncbi:hypothetical protein BC937DRAFT_88951 [Endogone sp. FLAS-F59071]|nr:hypothetical protein BC937DRAFT_88951 [Endogone sp. FLAS-F59071]|eukprot:RUS22470.1 hypothetical protein BC937DRAFT_88951 [Endogone sp. FLAS-F59071]